MPPRDLLPYALPNGITTKAGKTSGRLSVYFSPRMRGNGKLKNYPDWKNWPNTLGRISIEVLVNGVVRTATRVGPTPNPQAWTALFSQNTPVRRWRYVDRRFTPMKTFDETGLAGDITSVYQSIANKYPDAPPTYEQLLSEGAANDLLTGGNKKSALPAARKFMEPTGAAGSAKDPDFDFHQYLQSLNAHPYLLRLLGIVVDFEVDLPSGPTTVQVRTDITSRLGGIREAELITQTTRDFYALENPNKDYQEHKSGWLRLAQNYELLVLDSLTATQRLTGITGNAGVASEVPAAERSGALPPLSERGVTLARSKHSELLMKRFERRREVENDIKSNLTGGQPVDLYSEDITLGRRIDVRDDKNKTYRSLWQRRALDAYDFPRRTSLKVTPPPDEGWNTTALSTDGNESYVQFGEEEQKPTAMRRVSESIFNWNGWSGAASRPGNILDPLTGEAIEPPENKPRSGDPVQMGVEYGVVPGTLPRLRFGRKYWMRARAVDLAGNSRTVDEKQPGGTVPPPAFYGRLEPVAAPTVVRRGARPFPGVGDQPDVLVIKSDYDVPDAQVKKTDRVFFPSSIAQTVVERHGLPKGGNDPGSYGLLKVRDALSIETHLILDSVSGELVLGTRKGARIQPGPTNPAVVYLPDPAGVAAAFDNLPGTAGTLLVPFNGKWPAIRAAYLVVEAGSGAPAVSRSKNGSRVRVKVPKAAVVNVDVSEAIPRVLERHFHMVQRLTPAQKTNLRQGIRSGRHWMLSGRKQVQLIHAVRRPLLKPTITSMEANRPALGAETIDVTGVVSGSAASTRQLNFGMEYTDDLWLDDAAAPTTTTTRAPMGTTPWSAPPAPPTDETGVAADDINIQLTVSLYDSKRHLLKVKTTALSRFSQYFTEAKAFSFTNPVVLDSKGVVARSVEIRNATTQDAYEWGKHFTVNGKQGKVTRKSGIPAGTKVIARYVPLPISRVSTEGNAPLFEVDVPASLPPLSPTIYEVIPASSFTETVEAAKITRRRNGRLVRVWLKAPWFTSGNGERLAVLLDRSPGAIPTNTRYGRDVITKGPDIPNAPAAADFPRRTDTVNADAATAAAGHAVTYDPARGMMYSDIEVNAPGYRPFVRLTLAALQPNAIAGAYLSPPVHLDPMKLGTDRTVVVEAATSGPNFGVKVTVTGVEHKGILNAPQTLGFINLWRITWQEADPNIADPDLKWVDIGSQTLLFRNAGPAETTWFRNFVQFPVSANPLRAIIEEAEPSVVDNGGTPANSYENIVSQEIVEIPADWRS